MKRESSVQSVQYESDIIQITVGYNNFKEALVEEIFNELTRQGIDVDSGVEKNIDGENSKISFSIAKEAFPEALRVLEATKASLGFSFADFEVGLAKITILGTETISMPDVTSSIFTRLEKEEILVKTASGSDDQISVVVAQEDMMKAANALYDELNISV
ncbi:ACT domain-containing protein [Lysinibacillus sp. 54212]|uniref:ACT domain-containing protein n=1 Tax=Lysinibacillus sp. 54212 TaxID=3119829 RepID=UPI002FCC4173